MRHRIAAVISMALIAAGIIIVANAHDIAPALTMQDGSGKP
jgi:hypothetical protein